MQKLNFMFQLLDWPKFLLNSFINQFTLRENLWILIWGILILLIVFYFDNKILIAASRISIPSFIKFASTISPILCFPIIPILCIFFGIYLKNPLIIKFGKEYFSTLYLSLLESGVLSLIFIHERPNKLNLTFWETSFRSKSSFPSGHVIPYAALSIKGYQYYGIIFSVLPLCFLVFTSIERLNSRKHYMSDIIGGILLCILAANGSFI